MSDIDTADAAAMDAINANTASLSAREFTSRVRQAQREFLALAKKFGVPPTDGFIDILPDDMVAGGTMAATSFVDGLHYGISPEVMAALGPNARRSVFLHEIAHALNGNVPMGKDGGHNPEWKRICVAIGGDGHAEEHPSKMLAMG
jgi:hypothetical protein